MEESKVSMMQRKSIREAMDKGESLPVLTDRSKGKLSNHNNDYQVKFLVWLLKDTDELFNEKWILLLPW